MGLPWASVINIYIYIYIYMPIYRYILNSVIQFSTSFQCLYIYIYIYISKSVIQFNKYILAMPIHCQSNILMHYHLPDVRNLHRVRPFYSKDPVVSFGVDHGFDPFAEPMQNISKEISEICTILYECQNAYHCDEKIRLKYIYCIT